VTYETTEYDMDAVESANAENEEEVQATNSDDE
jgi:hypothetical protein